MSLVPRRTLSEDKTPNGQCAKMQQDLSPVNASINRLQILSDGLLERVIRLEKIFDSVLSVEPECDSCPPEGQGIKYSGSDSKLTSRINNIYDVLGKVNLILDSIERRSEI